MSTYKLTIPLHMNMDYVRLIMPNFDEVNYVNLSDKSLEVEIFDDEHPNSLCNKLDQLWCSKSPEGSVGFADFLQTFGAVEPNPFGRGYEGEPVLCYLLNIRQKELYGRIVKELDEFGDLSIDQVKEVYAALMQ
jgi:hypothetical protein